MPTYRSWISQVLLPAALALLFVAGPSQAEPHDWGNLPRGGGIVVDQQPHPFGGGASDTAFRDGLGFPVWQRIADDVLLEQPETIRRITWWGFYGGDYGDPEQPPETETMRFRFYHARPGDGLPDDNNILFEESFLNPSRTWTGRYLLTGFGQPEYIYEVDLPTPISLEADVPYWLEIAQLGDLESHFRWEFSLPYEDPVAFVNDFVQDWQYTEIPVNNAFQLWNIPEPGTAGLLLLGMGVLCIRRERRCWSMLSRWNIVVAVLAVLCVVGPSQAEPYDWDDLPRGGGGIVLDQQPSQSGGLASDTAFRDTFENPTWQQVADDVLLDSSATIRRVTWWGFYHEDNPPATETMRIRFYDFRPADGLPGDILFEESFLNPSRTATGLTVMVQNGLDEYAYEVDLTTPFDILADIPYWLEIVQLGDPDTAFRWEFGSASPEDQLAFRNPYVPDWMLTTSGLWNNAFQLSTVPEPSSLALFGLGLLLAGKRRSSREAKW